MKVLTKTKIFLTVHEVNRVTINHYLRSIRPMSTRPSILLTKLISTMKFFAIIISALFIMGCSQKSTKKVLIQPYGDIEQSFVDEAKKSIEKTFGFNVYIAPRLELPISSFVSVKTPRYRADSILDIQKKNKADTIDFIIGLTRMDISTTKHDNDGNVLKPVSRYADWGVFGLAHSPGGSSIVSIFRLGSSNNGIVLERLKKVCNHELGHNLGLPHCTNSEKCVLRDAAESIRTVDNVADTLCNFCKNNI